MDTSNDYIASVLILKDVLSNHNARIISLDINRAGAWKGLGVYDLDRCDVPRVIDAARTILEQHQGTHRGTLRITTSCPAKKVIAYYQGGKWEVRDAAA